MTINLKNNTVKTDFEGKDDFSASWGEKKCLRKINQTEIANKPKEEFKPEDNDIDNDPPLIEIAEAITVDSQAYTLKGKVKDKSKIYLTIDGRQVQVKKG